MGMGMEMDTGLPVGAALDTTRTKMMTMMKQQPHYCNNCVVVVIQDEDTGRGRRKDNKGKRWPQ